jgi:lysine 2,3-aminomutase
LQELFNTLAIEGIRPYYLFQNDPVYWADHFTVPLPDAMSLWSALRPRLSGLAATVKFTIEKEGSFGKIPVPEAGAWKFDDSKFRDFSGEWFAVG